MIFLLNTSFQGDCIQRSRRESGNEPSSFHHSATSGHGQGAESGGPPADVADVTDVNVDGDDAGDGDDTS